MKLRITILFSIIVLIYGCQGQTGNTGNNGTAWGVGSFDSNGKRIYFTATSDNGTSITYTGGSSVGMMMMGGNFTCASCHGVDAKGGRHEMQMDIMDAPDIHWTALSTDKQEMRDAGNKTLTPAKAYDFDDFKNAVENGKDPGGDLLKTEMPRWKMSDADLTDLMNYLKSLQ